MIPYKILPQQRAAAKKLGTFALRQAKNYGRKAYEKFKKSGKKTTPRNVSSAKVSKYGIGVRNDYTGAYGGYYTKGKKIKKKDDFMTKAAISGYHVTEEVYGKTSDPDCLYLTHSTYVIDKLRRVIMGALFRKLYKLAGVTVDDARASLPNTAPEDAAHWRIVYQYRNPQTFAIGQDVYNMPAGAHTVYDLCDQFTAMRTGMEQYLSHQNANIPYGLYLYAQDRSNFYDLGTDNNEVLIEYRVAAHIPLLTQTFIIKSISEMTIQNITAGALAPEGDKNIERVDNQPLSGKLVTFKGGNPRVRQAVQNAAYSNARLNVIREQGYGVLKASEYPASLVLQEPPHDKAWSNSSHSNKIFLNPGQSKKTKVSHVYKFSFNGKGLRIKCDQLGGVSPNREIVQAPGACQMFILEETLRTAKINQISIAWEKQTTMACLIKTLKPAPMQSDFSIVPIA